MFCGSGAMNEVRLMLAKLAIYFELIHIFYFLKKSGHRLSSNLPPPPLHHVLRKRHRLPARPPSPYLEGFNKIPYQITNPAHRLYPNAAKSALHHR
jgi:hypothetical protein